MMQYTVSIRPLPSGHWTINEEEGGGRLLGESDHFFDVLNLFAGSPPKSVSAAVLLSGEQKLFESCDFSVQVHYENGSLGQLLYTDLGHARFPRERLEVFCGGAVLGLEDYGRAEVLSKEGWKSRGKIRMGHAEELANFIGVILGKQEPRGTAADGLAATLVAQAAYRSVQTGGMVRIADLTDATGREPTDGTDLDHAATPDETALLGELFDATGAWDLSPEDEGVPGNRND
jgi:predicted dehydrogenase